MPNAPVKDAIRELFKEGELLRAAKIFFEAIPPTDTGLQNDVLQQVTRLNQLAKQQRDGTISAADLTLETNRVSTALIAFLDGWAEGGHASRLAKMMADHRFTHDLDFGPLLLVNCDRKKPVHVFNKKFKEKGGEKARFQFYFIAGCPEQMPDSLAERLIFQIIDEQCIKEGRTIDFQLRDGSKRVKILPAPLGSDCGASISKFKARVQERFKFLEMQSFESFIETGLPRIQYDFVAVAYSFTENDWDWDDDGTPSEVHGFLQWMAETFRSPHPDVPTFLFFFVAKINKLHLPEALTAKRERIRREFSELAEANASVLLKEIGPVEAGDVGAWLESVGINHPNDQRDLIDELARTLTAAERAAFERESESEKRPLPMKDVERMQETIYQQIQKTG